jgi:hypothetical protein
VSNTDRTITPTLRKADARERRNAQVRSSRVGSSPPRIHGRVTSTRTASVPNASFRRRTFEPVAFTTGRIRRSVSRFAARSRTLRSRKSSRFQTGSSTTRVSERQSGSA